MKSAWRWVVHAVLAELVSQAREAGYQVQQTEQLRTNRWTLSLTDAAGATLLVLAQHRPLITAADVQDLAELLRLGQFAYGVLLAVGGAFSPVAQRTAAELNTKTIYLWTAFPPAPTAPRVAPAFETI